jgi:nucleotide-binding universal stress UspA family protein
MNTTEVIVGVDSSAPARSALRWAAAEAGRRGARLRVLHAYLGPWPDAAYLPEQAENYAREESAALVADATARAHSLAPDIDVKGGSAHGTGAGLLLAEARPDDLIVVGSRGHSGFAAALLGSTSQQVAMHAHGAVAVVRGRADTAAGPVVVGVDGSPAAEHVLSVAFEEAAARDCGLTAVRVFHPATPAWPVGVPGPLAYNPATVRTALEQELEQTLRPWADKYPDVPVEQVVSGGDAAHVLVENSRSAQLVLVGSRGHGGFTGLLLGSVGLHLIHHADCPVLIARR